MKMSNECFELLKNEVTNLVSMDCIPEYIQSLKENPKIKSVYRAFIWKMYHLSSRNNALYEMVRKEGLYDTHIETALKLIIKSV